MINQTLLLVIITSSIFASNILNNNVDNINKKEDFIKALTDSREAIIKDKECLQKSESNKDFETCKKMNEKQKTMPKEAKAHFLIGKEIAIKVMNNTIENDTELIKCLQKAKSNTDLETCVKADKAKNKITITKEEKQLLQAIDAEQKLYE